MRWLLLRAVKTDIFSLALKHFAQPAGAGPKKRVFLVGDGAGWHWDARRGALAERGVVGPAPEPGND